VAKAACAHKPPPPSDAARCFGAGAGRRRLCRPAALPKKRGAHQAPENAPACIRSQITGGSGLLDPPPAKKRAFAFAFTCGAFWLEGRFSGGQGASS
jgi:hypothetical protein